MNNYCTPKRRPTRWEDITLEMLRIPIKHLVLKRGKWLAWEKPSGRSLKPNTDGSRTGAATTGGGVVRDSNGDFVLGYVLKCSHNDVLQAELDAIIRGLMSCRDRGLQPEVEVDLTTAFNMIMRRTMEAWQYEFLVRRIRRLLIGLKGVKLVYREQNGAADSLAKWTQGLAMDMVIQDYQELLIAIQIIIF